MVNLLRPVDVKLVFEDRPYRLGEAIDLVVELIPRRDIEVREGRVDLVCEERYTEISTFRTPLRTQMVAGRVISLSVEIPKRVPKEYRETYVHSSVVFLTNTRLPSGTTRSYSARLEIGPEHPPHELKAKVTWKLLTFVDVARARNVTQRRKVEVTLS